MRRATETKSTDIHGNTTFCEILQAKNCCYQVAEYRIWMDKSLWIIFCLRWDPLDVYRHMLYNTHSTKRSRVNDIIRVILYHIIISYFKHTWKSFLFSVQAKLQPTERALNWIVIGVRCRGSCFVLENCSCTIE